MWFDLHRFRSRAWAHRAWAALLGVGAFGLALLGLFAVAVGITMVVTEQHPSVGLLTLIVGVMSCGSAVAMVWRGWIRWQRWGRLDAIAHELSRVPAMPPADLQTALGWTRLALCEALIDAACWGVVSQLPSPLFADRGDGDALCIGDVLDGRFRLTAIVGEGGMGRVFRGVDVFSGQAVAVKTPHASANDRERLAREAQLLAQVQHPHVQRVRFVGHATGGSPYLVTEFLEGEGLDQRLERLGTIPWPNAVAIGRRLAEALAAVHAAGLLHRDIKPSNVLLERSPDGRERPVLIDFGLARQLGGPSALTRSGTAVGTPLYMSPEQARGEQLDARSDVYALAQLIYEMVTGTPPHFDITEAKVYQRLLHGAAAPMSHHAAVPEPLETLIAAALSRDPAQRPPSAQAFAAALGTLALAQEQQHVA